MATWTHRLLRVAAFASMPALLASPSVASAHSRRHIGKLDAEDRQAILGVAALLALPSVGSAHSPRDGAKPDEGDRPAMLHGTTTGVSESDSGALVGTLAFAIGGIEFIRRRRQIRR